MRRSLALRLAAAFAGVGIAAAALTAILVNLAFGTRFTSYLQDQQRVREQQLVGALAASYERMQGWDLEDLQSLESLALMDGGTMQLVDRTGRVVWDPSAGPGGEMAALHRRMMGAGALGPVQRLPVRVEGSVVGTAIVRSPEVGLLPQDVAFRGAVNRVLLLGGLVAAVAALGLGFALARRATAPARELTRAARALAKGERSVRVPPRSGDEMGEMARAFNSMADTIEEEDRLRRSFAADVAHELRTPLAILQTEVEGIQDGVVQPSARAMASLHEEVLRLSRLVADLEMLASADAAGFSLTRRPVDLEPLLTELVREFQGRAEAVDVDLRASLTTVTAEADETRICQVASNLLSNALKFTPSGGRVELCLASEGAWAVIRVSDTGPGIPPHELPHVFDRFFRGNGTRAGGSGIGLTVARELIRAHGGELSVASEPGNGATFTARLPMAQADPRVQLTPA